MSRELRREGLRELMDRLANFAWYTGGSDNRVDHADPLGVAGQAFAFALQGGGDAPVLPGGGWGK